MAYKQVINLPLVTDKPKTVFQHVRDFLTATGLYDATSGVGGWTVINSFYAVNSTTLTDNDWCLLQTTGETGVWDYRVMIKVTSLGIISWSGYIWSGLTTVNVSVSTRIGLSTECINTPANWTALYLYADKDFCAVVIRAGTTNYLHRFGILGMVYPGPFTPVGILSNVNGGNNINISVADSSPAQFEVGRRMQLFDYTTGGESSTITGNNTSTDIITLGNNVYQFFSATTKVSSIFPYVIDNMLSKTYNYSLALFVTNTDSVGPSSFGVVQYTPATIDALTPSPFTLDFMAHRVYYTTSNSGGVLMSLPDWCLVCKKRSVEAEAHTDGTNNYRYFSYNNDTTYVGFLFRE